MDSSQDFDALDDGKLLSEVEKESTSNEVLSALHGKGKTRASRARTESMSKMEAGSGMEQRQPSNSPSPSTGRKACCWGRLTKLQLAALLLLTGVLIGVGTVIVGPKIAAYEINRSEVTLTSLEMSNPDEADFKFDVAAGIKISNVAPLNGKLGAMDIDVLYKGEKLGTIAAPDMAVTVGKDNFHNVDKQPFVVEDASIDLWNDFMKAMLNEKSVDWVLQGTASVSSMGLTFSGLPFVKTVPITCFDGLSDIKMLAFDMTDSTADQVLVKMTMCLRNPTDTLVENLGDLFFGVNYESSFLGNVTSADTTVKVTKDDDSDPKCKGFGSKGYNALVMSGNIVPADREKVSKLMSRYFRGEKSPVAAKAQSPIANSLPLFNEGMQGLNLPVDMVGAENSLITSLAFNSAMISPVDESKMSMNMVAAVGMTNPLGTKSPLDIKVVDMDVVMGYQGLTVGRVKTGPVNVPEPNRIIGDDTLNLPAGAIISMADKGSALSKFAKDLIKLASLEMTLKGSSDATAYSPALGFDLDVEGLPINFPDGKDLGPVTVKGMGGLGQVKIKSYKIPGNVPDNTDGCEKLCGLLLEFVAVVNNPSPFGMEVGTLNGEILDRNGVSIGVVTTTGLTLAPGETEVHMTGKLSPQGDVAKAAAEQFMSRYLSNTNQKTSVLGKDAGPSEIPWLNDVVDGIQLAAEFPGAGEDFQVLSDINIADMQIELTDDGGVLVGCKVEANMNLPDQVDRSIIKDVDYSGMVFDLVDPDDGVIIGEVELDDPTKVSIQYNDSGSITASFEKTNMKVKDHEGMSMLVKTLMTAPSKVVKLHGRLSPHVHTNMGELQLSSVPFSGETVLYGFNNLIDPSDETNQTPLMQITGVDVTGGDTDNLHLSIDCDITNPSQITAAMGEMKIELWTSKIEKNDGKKGTQWYDSAKIGQVTIDNFTLEANSDKNKVTSFKGLKGVYTRPDTAAANKAGKNFLSSFVSGVDSLALIKGDEDGTKFDLLKPGLAALSTKAVVPGLEKKILKAAIMYPTKLHGLLPPLGKLPTALLIENVFSAAIKIDTASTTIYPCDDLKDGSRTECKKYHTGDVGEYTKDIIGVTVQPSNGSATTIERKDVKLNMKWLDLLLSTLARAMSHGAVIRMRGGVDVQIGDFVQKGLTLAQKDVPICAGNDHCWNPRGSSGSTTSTTSTSSAEEIATFCNCDNWEDGEAGEENEVLKACKDRSAIFEKCDSEASE